MSTIIDTHVHLYPHYSLGRAIANSRKGADPQSTLVWLLADRSFQNNFSEIQRGTSGLLTPGSCATSVHPLAISLQEPEGTVFIVSGKQIITKDRIEVLALGTLKAIPEGLSTHSTIDQVLSADGIAVLPWSPGKWMGSRGAIVENELRQFGSRIFVGDIAMRQTFAPRYAALSRGHTSLPGSDPLPLCGEDQVIGSYGLLSPSPFDPLQPVASLRRIFTEPFSIHGGRNSTLQALARFARCALGRPPRALH